MNSVTDFISLHDGFIDFALFGLISFFGIGLFFA